MQVSRVCSVSAGCDGGAACCIFFAFLFDPFSDLEVLPCGAPCYAFVWLLVIVHVSGTTRK